MTHIFTIRVPDGSRVTLAARCTNEMVVLVEAQTLAHGVLQSFATIDRDQVISLNHFLKMWLKDTLNGE